LGLNCTKAEAAKIERFLGISHEAGMSDAIRWKNSDNADDRSFAAWVLTDIGTPEAMEDLQTLSHDPNSDVATSAKYALEQVGQGPVIYKVRGSLLPKAPYRRANDPRVSPLMSRPPARQTDSR
jgi:HEAT repeat protein